MSIKVLSLVLDGAFPGSGSELSAMLALANYCDETGRCFPAINTIAEKIRLSRSQTQRVIHGLTKNGWVAVLANQQGGYYRNASCVYQLNLNALMGHPGSPRLGTHAEQAPHPCVATGSADATLSVNESSENHKQKKDGRAKSTPLSSTPDQFDLTDEMVRWATTIGIAANQVGQQTEKFLDYHRCKGGHFKDWNAAWRNWMRNSIEFERRRPQPFAAVREKRPNLDEKDYTKGVDQNGNF